jgi:hypothetical protein
VDVSMSIEVELDLNQGGRVRLEIAPPGTAKSAYVAFLPQSGNEQIWPLIRKIMATARQPIVQYAGDLRRHGVREPDVADGALRDLLRRDGYVFGPLWDLGRLPLEFDESGRKTFLFVRDPREIIARSCAGQPAVPAAELVRSPLVANLARQCRSFVQYSRARKHVSIVRYEDVSASWYRLVADLADALELEIPEETLFEIARTANLAAPNAPLFTFRDSLDQATRVGLEQKLGEALAYFGYAPEEVLPAAFLDHRTEFLRAVAARRWSVDAQGASDSIAADSETTPDDGIDTASPGQTIHNSFMKELGIRDEELRIRLKPGASVLTTVLGRPVLLDVDAEGCRPVLDQPALGEKTLAVYGCSHTFGIAVPAAETFCSLLQAQFPDWRVENHGVSGYAQTQNVMQLRRNSRWSAADYVTFCWIPAHHLRNVVEVCWQQHQMLSMKPGKPATAYPRAAFDRDGNIIFRTTRFPRWDLLGVDMLDFRPDAYYLDLIAAALFRRARDIVQESGGHFFVTTLSGQFSATLQRLLDEAGIPVVDASLDLSSMEYTCLPDDAHPNALAHSLYAEKIGRFIREKLLG